MQDASRMTWHLVSGGYRGIAAVPRGRHISSLTRRLLRILFIPVAFLLIIVLRCIDLFHPVRIGSLNAKGRISIMISYIEGYLRRVSAAGSKRPWVIIINPGACPNGQATKMYRRVVWLLDGAQPWLRRLFSLTYDLLMALRSPITVTFGGPDILKGYTREWQEGSPVLRFRSEEIRKGRLLLEKMGIAEGASFVCFGLREEVYYRQFLTPDTGRSSVNSEAEPETYLRNPLLQNYLPMAIQHAQHGLYMLRMGQVVGEPLPTGLPPNIIDYASKYRTPFGDIYLLGNCRFLVTGGAGGLWWIAAAFNRPVVMTDSYWIEVKPLRRGDLFIPKKLWHVSEKRFLTFREMLAVGMRYSYESNCRRDGIELVHNTPEEIAAVVDEMNRRLDGTWRSTADDDELQRRFDALYRPEHYGYGLPGQIGAQFLREHQHLLD